MLWLVAPSVVAVSTTALLAAGCAKGRDDAKRPKSSGSNRASNKQRQSGKSSRKAGSSSKSSRRDPKSSGAKKVGGSSKSSRRDPKAVAGAKKPSSRSKREGASSKSGRSSKTGATKKPLADPKKTGATAGAAAVGTKSSKSAGKSSSSKRNSDKDKLKKSADGSQRSSRSSKSKRGSKRSSRSKRSASASKKAVVPLQVDKTQEEEDAAPKAKDAALKTAVAVSVTKLELAPVDGAAKHEIRIEPSELRWKSTGGIQNVAVYNHSNVRKALKIKCSDNLLYRVNPVHAFVPAGGSVRVDILRQNGTAKVDKIVIVAADAGKDAANAREALARSANTDMMVLPLIATAAN